MEYIKYQHIERLGTTEVAGILDGNVYVFPKIDGTNGVAWLDDKGLLRAGSRNRELTLDKDNRGFYKYILDNEKYFNFLEKYPNVILYGEWLVPHTIKDYQDTAWNKFYVFDVLAVYQNATRYLPYEQYKNFLDDFDIDYIQLLDILHKPKKEDIEQLVYKNHYLMKEENMVGEGIVIKNYDYKNKYGRVTWSKVVYKEFNNRDKPKEKKNINTDDIELKIAEKYVTTALVEKEKAKIINEKGDFLSKDISRLLSTIYHCIITEEMWNILKTFKNPTIDFKKLRKYVYGKIKEIENI